MDQLAPHSVVGRLHGFSFSNASDTFLWASVAFAAVVYTAGHTRGCHWESQAAVCIVLCFDVSYPLGEFIDKQMVEDNKTELAEKVPSPT